MTANEAEKMQVGIRMAVWHQFQPCQLQQQHGNIPQDQFAAAVYQRE